MAIDRLGSAANILAALRAEVSQRSERTQRKQARAESVAPAVKRHRDMRVLRKQLADLVQSVDVRDADMVKKVRPMVVRTILLWDFGPEFREHPEWQPILESITHTLESQPSHQLQFLKLISDLKR